MKTLIKRSSFLLMTVLGITNLHAQSADEIISKHISALGGKDVINGVKSVSIESSVDVMGQEATSKTYIINGKGFKNETDFNGAKIVNCVSEKGGWAINPMAGQTTATAMPEDQLKASQGQFQVGGPLFDYATKGSKVEYLGKDTADYKLKLTATGGMQVTFFINTRTYLIDKQINKASVNGQDIETTVAFSNYKKTDEGYVMAYTQEVNYPQFSLTINHKKIDVNQSIDPAIFDMPK